jgi:hypothetical protein
MNIIIKERGWTGHFILGHKCLYRRNTLVSSEDIAVVVSTVGNMVLDDKKGVEEVGLNRIYETMVFVAEYENNYHEADVSKEVSNTTSNWYLSKHELREDSDNQADDMHDTMVKEVAELISIKDVKTYERYYDE